MLSESDHYFLQPPHHVKKQTSSRCVFRQVSEKTTGKLYWTTIKGGEGNYLNALGVVRTFVSALWLQLLLMPTPQALCVCDPADLMFPPWPL